MTPRETLLLPMRPNDSGALTVGGYLQALLTELWREGEGFSGKRPFGNSGWEYELYQAVIAGGAATGELDEDGGVDDEGNAAQVVAGAIGALFPEAWATADASRMVVAALRARADEIERGDQ